MYFRSNSLTDLSTMMNQRMSILEKAVLGPSKYKEMF